MKIAKAVAMIWLSTLVLLTSGCSKSPPSESEQEQDKTKEPAKCTAAAPKAIQEDSKLIIIANQANYELAKDVIKFIETRGVPILNITPSEFDTYKKSKHLLILGGPNETGRLGEIAREMLSKEEQDWASQMGNKKMYLKMDKWREEQYILVFAGYDGNATYRALINNKDKWWAYISSWFDIELSHEEIYGY